MRIPQASYTLRDGCEGTHIGPIQSITVKLNEGICLSELELSVPVGEKIVMSVGYVL